jgi:hypothetical protein
MFQDEARFGRVRQPADCWAPAGIRPIVPQQIIREYTYAYSALSPQDGRLDSLILPDMYADTMGYFLEEVSSRYPNDYILMVMDGAPCHRAGTLNIPNNIKILQLPPYSPQLNPVENFWAEVREKWFANCVFRDMEAVTNQLVDALIDFESDQDRIASLSQFPWIKTAIKTYS